MPKSTIGFMIEEDYNSYEKYLKEEGVTHADIFRDKPPQYYPLKTIKVKITIEKLKEE